MHTKIYPCIKGWTQFYSTTPKHWCCILKPPYYGVGCNSSDIFYKCVEVKVSYGEKYLVIVDNETDTPNEWDVDMLGYLKNPTEYMLKIKNKRYGNTDKV